MKFVAFAIAAIVAIADSVPAVMPPTKALEVAQSASAPSGVEFTGSVESIEQPAGAQETINALQTAHDAANDDKKEHFGWGAGYGWGLGGGWGNWGGWGGYGPYRFGFRCGGVPGWAYPLHYWTLFATEASIKSCGLGVPLGGLFFC